MNRCPHRYDDSYAQPYWCTKNAGHAGLHESDGNLPVRWHGHEMGAFVASLDRMEGKCVRPSLRGFGCKLPAGHHGRCAP